MSGSWGLIHPSDTLSGRNKLSAGLLLKTRECNMTTGGDGEVPGESAMALLTGENVGSTPTTSTTSDRLEGDGKRSFAVDPWGYPRRA